MRGKTPWSPWHHLREHYPHVTVWEMELPAGVLGYTNFRDTVWLTTGLTCAEQRCTLAHEIGHLERGPIPKDPWAARMEERLVDEWAARLLIPVTSLVRAFQWSQYIPEIAEELWVDEHMLRARLRCLSDEEQDGVMTAIARLWSAA